MNADTRDVARFRGGDHPSVVEACLCCGFCLRRAALVIVGVRRADGQAWCYCSECEAHTEVALNAEQVVRLVLAPPRGGRIHLVREEDV